MAVRVPMTVPMTAAMIVVTATAEQEGAGDVDGQADAGDRDGLGKVDRHRHENPADGFIADQQGDHGEDDGAGEAREIAELAGPECETTVMGMPARVAIGECRQ